MNADKSDIIYRIAAAFSNATACPECVDVLVEARDEIERLRLAIRKIAEQDATLSVCGGNVTVTMDFTLTDAEREAVERAISRESDAEWYGGPESERVTVLRALLERFK